ncbi:MAG: tetratricopeptide repeat protein, partial [Candidatus Marinimicrobia bacterium]|nr:tetratricopeptide repeat protein [Candidatus Neomarinimicrobiota bacterium]
PWMAVATAVLILAVPVNMLVANYNEHDRSGNYVAWEYSYNLLNSCEPNGILFTNGDNDTFPLWYLQEVEGIRKDVRVVNLSLLNTPWYIMQLKTQEPKVKIRLSDDVIRNIGMVPWEEREYYIPGPDPEQPFDQMQMLPADRELGIRFNLKPTIARRQNPNTGKLSGGLKVQDLMILEILQANRWQKPVYFAVTIAPSNKLGLDEYLRMDGQVFKVLPYKVGDAINADVLYDNMINKYRYTNLDDPSVNFPDNVRRLLQNYRSGFLQMVYYYGQQQGDREKALEILQFMDENLPDEVIPNTYAELYLQIAQLYAQYGDSAAARDYLENFFKHGRGRNDIVAVARVAGYWNDIFDDTDRAISILLPLTENNQQNPYVSYELARVYLKKGDLANAERWVNSLGQLAPNAQETQQLKRQLVRMQMDTLR